MTKNKTLVALHPEGFLESGFSLFIKKGTVNPVSNLILLRILTNNYLKIIIKAVVNPTLITKNAAAKNTFFLTI